MKIFCGSLAGAGIAAGVGGLLLTDHYVVDSVLIGIGLVSLFFYRRLPRSRFV